MRVHIPVCVEVTAFAAVIVSVVVATVVVVSFVVVRGVAVIVDSPSVASFTH